MLRRARIYLGATAKEAIVAALHHNSAGISFEQEGPAVIANWRQAPALGVALRLALERFSPQERNLRDLKKLSGPATARQDLVPSVCSKPPIPALAFKR
jgi:hypothetical protein